MWGHEIHAWMLIRIDCWVASISLSARKHGDERYWRARVASGKGQPRQIAAKMTSWAEAVRLDVAVRFVVDLEQTMLLLPAKLGN